MEKFEFEWNIEKAKQNLIKHNVSFEEAMSVWEDEYATLFYDNKNSDIEDRYIFIGYSNKNNLLLISFTQRDNKYRIISSRKATSQERKNHERYIK